MTAQAWIEDSRWLVNASLSADGSLAAVALGWREGEEERRAIRLVEVEAGEVVAELDSGASDDLPAFAPQGRSLAFVSRRSGGIAQLHLRGDEGEPRRLSSEPRGVVGAPLWSPDGSLIAIQTYSGTASPAGRPRRVTRPLWRADGFGIIEDSLTELLLVEAAPPHRSWRVGGGLEAIVRPLDWRDERTVVAGVMFRTEAGPGQLHEQLFELDVDGGSRELAPPRGAGLVAGCLPGGEVVYTTQVEYHEGWGRSGRLWVLGRDGSETRISEELPWELIGSQDEEAPGDFLYRNPRLWFDDGALIVRGQRRSELAVYRVPLADPAAAEPLLAEPHRNYHPLELRGRRLLVASTTLNQPATISFVDLDGGESKPIEPRSDDERVELPPLRVRRRQDPCEHWVVQPPGEGAGPYPTVLFVHGGPYSSFGEMFCLTVHLLARAGFAVLMANPIGSAGYGDEFGEGVKGDFGGRDAEQLLRIVDQAVEAGVADPARLGIAGASYGGYMSCLLGARSRRFAAAVAEAPVTDLVGMEGTSDVSTTFLPGYFGDDEERMREVSPLTYAKEAATPTLLILGDADYRVDPTQGIAFFTALRHAGCPAEMLLLPEADHWGKVTGPVPGRRAQEEALVEWFDRYLNGAG